jgi:tetratricopeptide (TPR) repeat protein
MDRAREVSDEATFLERNATSLTAEGNPIGAVRSLERSVALRVKALKYAEGSSTDDFTLTSFRDAVSKSSEKLVMMLNSTGVAAFRQQRFDESDTHLNAAMKMLDPPAVNDFFPTSVNMPNPITQTHPPVSPKSGVNISQVLAKLQSTTLNNLGCLERRRGNLDLALNYLKKSTKIFGSMSPINLLNMSAICTALQQPEEALKYSKKAVELLQFGLSTPMQFAGLLAVAHHNIAIATEVSDPTESHAHYKKALEVARKELGNNNPTTALIQKNMSNFVQSRRQFQPLTALPRDPLDATSSGSLEGSDTGPNEEVLQSVDLSTAVLMDTVRGKRSTNSPVQTGTPLIPTPPTHPDSAPKVRPTPPSSAGKPPKPSRRSTSEGKRLKESREKNTGSLGPPLPPGLAPGEMPKDEEERRKEDLLTYLYGRLKELIKHEDWFEQRYLAAVRIQCAMRRYLARKRVAVLKKKRRQRIKKGIEREKQAAQVIVRFLKGIVRKRVEAQKARAKIIAEKKIKETSAVKIQSIARRWLAKQYMKRLRNFNKRFFQGICRLQCWFRLTVAKMTAKRMRVAQKAATEAMVLQVRRHRAASLIQKVFRGHRGRINVLVLKGDVKAAREMDWQSNRVHAASRIQRLWRGYRVRKHTSSILRGQKKRRLISERTKLRREAATSIQKVFRGHHCREEHPEVPAHCAKVRAIRSIQTREAAAVKIQTAVRRWIAKRVFQVLAARRRELEAERRRKVHKPFIPPEDWQFVRRERMLV